MNKLKNKKINNLLNYQHFLKNNFLKEKKIKLKNILFENQILYKNNEFNVIELNNIENIFLPSTILEYNNIYSVQTLYENQILFNYNLNYNILYNFNKILFNYKKKINNNIIKGRIVNGNHKKILISILGLVFFMKSINLNSLINNKKNFYKNKKKYRNFFFLLKKFKTKQIIKTYKLRYLNFKVEKIKNKNIFSRNSYLEEIFKYWRTKNFKKVIFLEKNKKKNKVIFQEKKMRKKK